MNLVAQAFAVTEELGVPSMQLHYNEYAINFEKTRDRLLRFLELPRVGEGVPFTPGKTYREYYKPQEKKDILAFLMEYSDIKTWQELKRYDFGSSSIKTKY